MVGNASKLLGIATFMLASRAAADLPGHEPHLAGRGALGAELGGTMGFQSGTAMRASLWDLSLLVSVAARYFVADRVALGVALGLQRSSRDACTIACYTSYRTAAVGLLTASYFAPLSRAAYFVPELGVGAFGGEEESVITSPVAGVQVGDQPTRDGVLGVAARLSPGLGFVPWPRLWVFVRPDFFATFSKRPTNLYQTGSLRLDLDFGATLGVSHAF
ncbi:MAG: hypothetical protein HOO96_41930 [Polyangiaceae bacterium]|nr:hypothetical protein [Polyangiaceae bacterium]